MLQNFKNLKLPDTLVLIFSILIIITILTWFYPGGKYDRQIIDGREMVQPESYAEVESVPQGLGSLLTAPIKGFIDLLVKENNGMSEHLIQSIKKL